MSDLDDIFRLGTRYRPRNPEIAAYAQRQDDQAAAARSAIPTTAVPGEHIVYVDPSDDPAISDPAKTWICQTCDAPINRLYTDGEGFNWVHAREHTEHDHQPDPIQVYRDGRREADCDFCGLSTIPNWAYEGNHLTSLAGGSSEPVRDWGTRFSACDPCAALIDRDVLTRRDFTHLLHRARQNPALRATEGENLRAVEASDRYMLSLWTYFFRDGVTRLNIGPPTRLDARRVDKYRRSLLTFWNHPGLYQRLAGHGLKPHAVPGFCCGEEFTDQLIAHATPGKPVPEPAFNNLRHHITTGINAIAGTDGGQYWISDRFTDLAEIAGTEFKTLTMTRKQLPAAHGFAVYAHPIDHILRPEGRAGIRAFTWTLIPGGIWVNLYFQTEDGDPYADATNARAEYGEFLSPSCGAAFAFDTDIPLPDDTDAAFIRTIFATWLFLTQPGVAEQQPAPTNKKEARAYQRTHGRKQPDVILVDLRRRRRTGTGTPTGPRGPLKYIRYTPGHWRYQRFGPKRGQRELIYISPYVSGPEDAPLRPTTPTVKVLR